MRKITYIILSLCLCTAGIGTAARMSSAQLFSDTLAAINDTIPDEEEDYFGEDEEEEDEEGEYDEEEDEEYDEEGYDEEDEEEDDEEGEYEEDDEEDEDEDAEYDEEDDEEDEEDDGFFTDEEEEEFGEMHDLEEEVAEAEEAEEDSLDTDIALTEGMRVSAEEQMEGYNAQNYLSGDTTKSNYVFQDTDAAVYIERLRRMPVLMEMPYNEVVRKYIDQYANRMKRSVSIMLGVQNFYNEIFEQALEAEGCPLELKYLPVIESAYNPAATSPVGAAGLWQFMPATGKNYGLEINTLVDERRDPVKSSKAAAKYLKHLYKIYGDWNLVIAAYNCGPGNVNKAIQRSGGSKDYWAIYNYLPRETRGYVPAFIAANYVMTYYCDHGIEPMQARLPAETDTIMVSRDLHLRQVADLCEVSFEQLKELNPQYRTQVIPGYWKPCILRMPTEAISKFIGCGDSIYTYRASELLPRRSVAAIAHGGGTTATRSSSGSTGRTYSRSSSYSRSNTYRRSTTTSRGTTTRGKAAPRGKAPVKGKAAPRGKAPAKGKAAPRGKAPVKGKAAPRGKAPVKGKAAPRGKAPAKGKPAPKGKAPAKAAPKKAPAKAPAKAAPKKAPAKAPAKAAPKKAPAKAPAKAAPKKAPAKAPAKAAPKKAPAKAPAKAAPKKAPAKAPAKAAPKKAPAKPAPKKR